MATPHSKDITEVQVNAVTGEIASGEKETPADQKREKGDEVANGRRATTLTGKSKTQHSYEKKSSAVPWRDRVLALEHGLRRGLQGGGLLSFLKGTPRWR